LLHDGEAVHQVPGLNDVAEDDWVVGRCTTTATHAKTVMGAAPTNRQVQATFWDMHRFDADGIIEALMGILRTHCSGLAATCSRDLSVRRSIDKAVDSMLHAIADEATKRSKEISEVRDGATPSRNGANADDDDPS